MSRAGKYLTALARKDWPVDAFTCHIYPEIDKGFKRWAAMLDDVTASLASYHPPVEKLWITETAYGLLGDNIPDEKADQLVTDTYANDGGRFLYWYAPNRDDLGGMAIVFEPPSAAWTAIQREG
jgi:hypothetical protein